MLAEEVCQVQIHGESAVINMITTAIDVSYITIVCIIALLVISNSANANCIITPAEEVRQVQIHGEPADAEDPHGQGARGGAPHYYYYYYYYYHDHCQ